MTYYRCLLKRGGQWHTKWCEISKCNQPNCWWGKGWTRECHGPKVALRGLRSVPAAWRTMSLGMLAHCQAEWQGCVTISLNIGFFFKLGGRCILTVFYRNIIFRALVYKSNEPICVKFGGLTLFIKFRLEVRKNFCSKPYLTFSCEKYYCKKQIF